MKSGIADPSSKSGSSLSNAAEKNQTAIVSLLLAQGAETNWGHPSTHISPLHYAAENDNAEMVINLREYNASETLHTLNSDRATPIVLAAKRKHWNAVIAFTVPVKDKTTKSDKEKTLISNKDTDSGLALIFAAMYNHTAAVKALSAAGADTSWTMRKERFGEWSYYDLTSEEESFTALHWAVHYCNIEMIIALRKAGASETTRDNNRHTPIEFSSKRAYKETIPAFWNVVTAFAISLTDEAKIAELIKNTPMLPTKEESKLNAIKETQTNVASALSGDNIAIKALAQHYRNKKEYSKAVIFTALDITAGDRETDDIAKGINYITSIQSSVYLRFNNYSLTLLCALLLRCITNTKSENYLPQQKRTHDLSTDPIKLLLLLIASEREADQTKLAKAKTLMEATILAVFNDMGLDKESATLLLKAKNSAVIITMCALEPVLDIKPTTTSTTSTLIQTFKGDVEQKGNVQEKILDAALNEVSTDGNKTSSQLLQTNGTFAKIDQLNINTTNVVDVSTNDLSPTMF